MCLLRNRQINMVNLHIEKYYAQLFKHFRKYEIVTKFFVSNIQMVLNDNIYYIINTDKSNENIYASLVCFIFYYTNYDYLVIIYGP